MKNSTHARSFRLSLAAFVTVGFQGCASISLESTQGLQVRTVDAAGKPIDGARCVFTNDKGQFVLEKTPGVAQVGRSYKDMDVVCTKADATDGTARLISRAGRIWGNLILGGGIGAVVDRSTGKGYNYPFIFDIIMGRFTEYDRHNQENDQAAKSSEVVDGVAPPPRSAPAKEAPAK
jgi:hypothetical protein